MPHTAEIFATIKKVQQIAKSVSSYTDGKTIDKGTTVLREKGGDLVNGVKGLFK